MALHLPNSQKATQTLVSAPLKASFSRPRNMAQDDEGDPGRGNAIVHTAGAYLAAGSAFSMTKTNI
jgi:hypothetical protein